MVMYKARLNGFDGKVVNIRLNPLRFIFLLKRDPDSADPHSGNFMSVSVSDDKVRITDFTERTDTSLDEPTTYVEENAKEPEYGNWGCRQFSEEGKGKWVILDDVECRLKLQDHIDFFNDLRSRCEKFKKTRVSSNTKRYEFEGCNLSMIDI